MTTKSPTVTTEEGASNSDLLPDVPNFENIRQSIAARCATSDNGWTELKARSGELLKAAMMGDTQAVVVFEVKYGEKPGYRTIVFTRPTTTDKFCLVTSAFAATPQLPKIIAKADRSNWKSVIDYQPKVEPLPMSPADGTSPAMSYTFHVRSMGDHRVICSTTSLADAKRIVAALGNCAVFQFRNGTKYDDETMWKVV